MRLYAGLGGCISMMVCGVLSASGAKVPVAIGVHLALVPWFSKL